jgi:tRNA pseudouridine55 synthase
MNLEKTYTTTINLQAFSETDDAEGPLNYTEITDIPSQAKIKTTLNRFIGTQLQTPPAYSAVKVDGIKRYTEARRGASDIVLPQRTIQINDITINVYNWPELDITVTCSKGTYIRSLARDIGTALNTGGYVQELQRTAIGTYRLDQAYDLQDLTDITPEMLCNLYPKDT